jgi:hypothetical protein
MSDSPRRRLPTVWFYGAVAVSVLLVAATALSVPSPAPGSAPSLPLLARFSLARENNPAAWWSGMLLAVMSLHAFDGHALLRRREPGAAKGWALLAAVLLFLSADEVGSIHEQLGDWGEALGLGTWSLLLPLGAVLAAMLGRALVLLWSAGGEQRRKVRPIAIGFLILGSVALQEELELRIQWQTDAARAVRAAVEEGTELIGMLVLLRVAMANTAGLAVRGAAAAGGRPAFAALHELRRPLAALGLALAPVLAFVTAALFDQLRGHPADWLAAVAFLAAGLAPCRRLFEGGGGIGRLTWGLCGLASVATVAIGADKLVGLGPVEVSLRMLVLGAISLLVCATWLSTSGSGKRAYLSGAVVLGLLAALSPLLSTTSLALAYTLPQLLGLVVYWVNSMLMQQEIEESAAVSHGLAVSARR